MLSVDAKDDAVGGRHRDRPVILGSILLGPERFPGVQARANLRLAIPPNPAHLATAAQDEIGRVRKLVTLTNDCIGGVKTGVRARQELLEGRLGDKGEPWFAGGV
jgi:hypothetical protein